MYSCGPSLDGPPDLGLCRRVVFSDVLRRHLECRGYQVKHAMNLGDIDDRTVKECLKAGGNLREFTARWEKVFFESLEMLCVKRAHHYPKASEHVGDMVDETRSLLEMGLAYEKLRSVYFRISSFSDYGRLSGIEPDRMRSEASTGPTVRYWLLATHYRTVLHYSLRELERAAKCVTRLNEFAARLVRFRAGRRGVDVDQALHEVQTAWRDAMDNDLNVPKALGKLFPFVREINRLLDREELDGDQVGQILNFMRQINDVLGVLDFGSDGHGVQVAKLLEARENARRTKDFHTADTIRKELESMGIRVADSPLERKRG